MSVLSFASLASAVEVTWQTATPMLEPRSDFVVLADRGIFYINGGCLKNQTVDEDCEEITSKFNSYNSLTGEWLDLLPSPYKRMQYTAAAVPLGDDTLLYYFGGFGHPDDNSTSPGDDPVPLYDVDVYSVNSRQWARIVNGLPPAMWRSNAPAFVIDQVIYVAGGYISDYISINTVLMLNTSGREIASQTFVMSNVTKPIASGDSGAVVIDGKGYVFGGFTSDNGYCPPINSLEVFDPATPERPWSLKATMHTARGDAAFANVAGLLFLMGGEECNSVPTDDVEYYNPSTDTWTYMSDLPSSRFRLSGSVGGPNKQTIYVIGGQNSEVENSTTGVDYHPVTSLVESCDVSSIVAEANDSGANDATTKSWVASIVVVVVACIALL